MAAVASAAPGTSASCAAAVADPAAEPEPPGGRGDADPRGRTVRTPVRVSVRPLEAARSAPLRARIGEILGATGVFRLDEISVALELYDSARGTRHSALGGAACRAAEPPRGAAPLVPSSDYLFLGAFTPEDELVGYACYGPTPGTDRSYDLYWIAVDPARHGAGIGTILLDEVERGLLASQARVLIVETSSRSDYAGTRAFYARRGYGEAARVRGFYAPGDDRIIYTKRFHPHSPTGRERSRDE